MRLFRNIGSLLTLEGVVRKDGRSVTAEDLGVTAKGAVLVEGGHIVWAGAEKELPRSFRRKIRAETDLKKRTVLPAFVECHTHAVFAGSRAAEFELRNQGVDYLEISRRGGGILSTVRATRAATTAQLVAVAEKRLAEFLRQGVSLVEIKTGYGLDAASELKTLQAIARLRTTRVIPTFLGAHSIPKEFSSAREYLGYLRERVVPFVKKKKLAARADIFVEKGFFEAPEAREYLAFLKAEGFDLAVHADQLTASGGTQLAIELGALSADHVIQIGDEVVRKLAASEVTAVLLPAADLYMKCAYPPARKLLDAGARVALATDFNPGTAPTQDLALVGLLARLEMKMTLPEVIAAYTHNAAKALRWDAKLGSLTAGKLADFSVFDEDWDQLFYVAGGMHARAVYRAGKAVL